MYYGFYSYEADDVAIIGNKYINNAIYGIDPHDRSRRLIIAENETSGSGKKHGIIISRNVNDSWIFSNYSHDNHGSGIMLDRSCEHDIVANNTSAYNKGDGITFFESMNDTVYNNKIYQNGLSGIRIRNSWNIRSIKDEITDNARVPMVVYSMDLLANGKPRDIKQDPYSIRTDATVSGSLIKLSDRKPSFKLDGVNKLVLSDIRLLSGGPVFAGQLFADETAITNNMDSGNKSILFINNPAPLTRLSQR
jgi:poly(beta-D-mannuronate) C5 epimerase